MSLEIGEVLHDRYRIDALLGEGGMGAVYRAVDLLHDTLCAVKEFRLGYLPVDDGTRLRAEGDETHIRNRNRVTTNTRQKAAEQFFREAKLLANLDHPNLPKVTDFFSEGEDYYLVMNLIKGQDLATVLEEVGGKPLPEERVMGWMKQVMEALRYCHEQGVIHRDVKPANVIVTEEGKAYLVDFGIAKSIGSSGETTIGARATTPGYSPIEQYGQGHTDVRSDIYSLGAMLYALLTGREPIEVIDRLQGEKMHSVRALNRNVSASVDEVVRRAMSIKPAGRFQSIAEMQGEFQKPSKETDLQSKQTEVIAPPVIRTFSGDTVASRNDQHQIPPPWLLSLEGHAGSVTAVAITPDGARVVSGSYGKILKVWDLHSGRMLRSLEGHLNIVNAVAVTPDGKKVVSGSTDKTIKVWDLQSGRLLCSMEGHTWPVRVVAVTADGAQIISGSWDCTLKVWDLESGQLITTLGGHEGFVNTLAVTPDSTKIVSGSADNTLKVWDLKRGLLLRSLEGHTDRVTAVAVTPDGAKVVSGSYDNTLKIWDLQSGRLLHSLEGHLGVVTALAVAPGGSKVISGSYDNTLKVWDLKSGRLLHSLKGHKSGVSAVAVTPDGKQAISGSYDNTVKVWDLLNGCLHRSLEGHTKSVTAIAITPRGAKVISGSDDSTLKVWDLQSGRRTKPETSQRPELSDSELIRARSEDDRSATSAAQNANSPLLRTLEGHTKSVTAVAVTPDNAQVVSGSMDKTLKIWDLKSGSLIRSLTGNLDWVSALAVTPDGAQIVSGSLDKTLKVWDLKSGRWIHSMKGHNDIVRTVAVTPDGAQVVSGSIDKTLKVWDLESGRLLRSLEGHTSPVTAVAITPDGTKVVSGSFDGTLKVWTMNSGHHLRTLEKHEKCVAAVAITPDGTKVVSGSYDKTLKVWDLRSGHLLRSLEGHRDSVTAVAVTPDGTQIVSGSDDRTLNVWDLKTGSLLYSLEGHTGSVNAVAVTPDGTQTVSGSWDKTLKVWDIQSKRWSARDSYKKTDLKVPEVICAHSEDTLVADDSEGISPSEFFDYAGSNVAIWQKIIGRRLTHNQWEGGTIINIICGENISKHSFVSLKFDHQVDTVRNGLTDVVDLGLFVFSNGTITHLSLPIELVEEIHEAEKVKLQKAEEERKRREFEIGKANIQYELRKEFISKQTDHSYRASNEDAPGEVGYPDYTFDDYDEEDTYERYESDIYEEEDEDDVYEN